jgi:TatD DNase family protein
MHCFSGDLDVVARCVEAGYYTSFAGNVTFRNAATLREAAAAVPPELLLTETDSPYLTPHPHRGEANDPSFVPFTARTLAEVQGRNEEELLAQLAVNTERAFALPAGSVAKHA